MVIVTLVAPGVIQGDDPLGGEILRGNPRRHLVVPQRPVIPHLLHPADSAVDKAPGLEPVDQIHQLPGSFGRHIGEGTVRPENRDGTIVGHQLLDLGQNLALEIPPKVLLPLVGKIPVVPPGAEAHVLAHGTGIAAILLMPVQTVGIVEAHLHPVPGAGLRQLPDKIPVAGGVHAVVVGVLGLKEAKSVVVLGGEDQIAKTRPGEGGHQLVRVEVHGIELPGQLGVFLVGNAEEGLDPLPDVVHLPPLPDSPGNGVKPPMKEGAAT